MFLRRVFAATLVLVCSASFFLTPAQAQAADEIRLDIALASGMKRQAMANGEVNQEIFVNKSSGWSCRLIRPPGPPQASLMCANNGMEASITVACSRPETRSANLILSYAEDHRRIVTFALNCL